MKIDFVLKCIFCENGVIIGMETVANALSQQLGFRSRLPGSITSALYASLVYQMNKQVRRLKLGRLASERKRWHS